MKKITSRLFLLILITLMVSCQIIPDQAMTEFPDIETGHNRQLTHEALDCNNMLCWNGIIIGVSTYDEALKLIEEMYGEINIRAIEQRIQWERDLASDSVSGYVEFDDHSRVARIEIFINKDRLEISDLFDWIGEPALVHVVRAFSSEAQCAGVAVLYPEDGIIGRVYPENESVGIAPGQFVQSLTLLDPEGSEDWTFTDTWEVEWQGFTDYCDLAINMGDVP